MKKSLLLLLTSLILVSFKGDKNAFQIFDENGKNSEWEKLIKEAKTADVVFFGELHDNSIGHWLELQVLKELYENKKENLYVGAEMFEADDQVVIDEYLSGFIKETHLETEAKIWKNYKTDYKPLMNFCKERKIHFVGTNIPRRYASLVAKEGLTSLEKFSTDAKRYIAPLPISFDKENLCYKKMIVEMGGGHNSGMNMEYLAQAQASKDATMAYFIHKNLKAGNQFYHVNGSYHSDYKDGIIYYLKKLNPNLKIVTISTVEQDAIEKLEDDNKKKADFVIAIPSDMIKTY